LEDLISIGTIGLIKAIESFSPNKGTKLATFAARCIENEILMHLRSLKKTRKDVSLHDPIGTDKEGNEITLIDILGSEADDVVDAVQLKIEKSKIYRNLEILDDREKEVVVGEGSGWSLAAKSGRSGRSRRSWGLVAHMCHG
jgi:RNA polymerase sporulation-specific sigma factor